MADVKVVSWKEAGDIAKVAKSKVAKSILEVLGTSKKTASALSKEIQSPLTTTLYHLKALERVGLVQVTHYHYSKKGKEVSHYALVQTPLIILPQSHNAGVGEQIAKFVGALVIPALSLPFLMSRFFGGGSVEATSLVADSAPQAVRAVPERADTFVQAAPLAEKAIEVGLSDTQAWLVIIAILFALFFLSYGSLVWGMYWYHKRK